MISPRILFPVNYTPLAGTALRDTLGLAEKTGGELVLAHVREHHEAYDDRNLREWAQAEAGSRCTVKEVMLKGVAAEQIVAEARRCGANLIVQGAQPRSFVGTVLFGSTSELVIRKASCPVLSMIRKDTSAYRLTPLAPLFN